MTSVTAKVRRIGNSRGVLFPKTILDASGIKDNVKITVKNKVILISAAPETNKKNWAHFKKEKNKALLIANKFDETEWTW